MGLLVFPGFECLGHTAPRLLEYKQFLDLSLGEPKFLLEISIPSRSMSVGGSPQKQQLWFCTDRNISHHFHQKLKSIVWYTWFFENSQVLLAC